MARSVGHVEVARAVATHMAAVDRPFPVTLCPADIVVG
jgi:hypothetical protein